MLLRIVAIDSYYPLISIGRFCPLYIKDRSLFLVAHYLINFLVNVLYSKRYPVLGFVFSVHSLWGLT